MKKINYPLTIVLLIILNAIVLILVQLYILPLSSGKISTSKTASTAVNNELEAISMADNESDNGLSPNDLEVLTDHNDNTFEAAEPLQPEIETVTVKLAFTGDLMAHQPQLDDAYDHISATYDFTKSLQNVKPYLSDADFTIGNLETTLAGEKIGYSDYPMFNTPDAYAAALQDAGFDLLSTANNHCNDKWEAGILRTLDILDGLGIEHIGTYRSQSERDDIFIKDINGISFAFLSYTYGTNGLPLTEGKDYLANIMDETLIKSDIAAARALNPDFIVVLPHMGNEYERYPKQVFKNWIDMMLNAGADIVVASHPHVLQPMEYVELDDGEGGTRGCFIAYSMGNFLSSQRTEPRDSGMILNLTFTKTAGERARIENAGYIPTWVKYRDAAHRYDIQVLSVYDTLQDYWNGLDLNIKDSDIKRIMAVHGEVSELMLGEMLPIEEIKNEYEFPLEEKK